MGPIGRFFRGESTSEVGLTAGLRRDVWTAMQPDLRVLNAAIRDGNRQLADAAPQAQAFAIAALSPALPDEAAPGHLPPDRQSDGDLDLARRPDRARRRADGAVAVARRAPPAGRRASTPPGSGASSRASLI